MSSKKTKRRRSIRYFDYSLLVVIIFLLGFGLVMLYSASSYDAYVNYGDSMHFFKLQLRNIALGLATMAFVSRLPYRLYEKYCFHAYALALFLMLLVYATPLGVELNGARRWLKLPGFTFQPSEIMKIAIILVIPYVICKMEKQFHTFKGTMFVFGIGAFAFLSVYLLTDNLSTALIVLGIMCVILFVAHKQTGIFLVLLVGALIAFFGGSYALSELLEDSTSFRLRRILAWLHPENYAQTSALQTLQGLYAIGSGGFFGKGLGNSMQKMKIPEVQNDMLFSIICEELGVFGAIMVFLLFGLLIYRLIFIAQNAPDTYSALVVTGIAAHIALQVILNIAVVTNVIPNTGVTLPFISYGGTAIIFLMVEMGIALNVSRYIKITS